MTNKVVIICFYETEILQILKVQVNIGKITHFELFCVKDVEMMIT